jgi:biotin carboxyl carrier protein
MSESWRIGGKRVVLPKPGADAIEARPGGWLVVERADGTRERFLLNEGRGQLGASLGGSLWQGALASDRAGAHTGADTRADLTAQFPGKVRKVLVSVGDAVAAGDPLVLVEAMKMEFAVKAPVAGRVKAVNVKEGQPISPGDVFAEVEA